MNQAGKGSAKLAFATKFHSVELGNLELPVEVRRSNLTLVARTLSTRTLDVEPGEYFIISRLPAGQEIQSHVTIGAGEEQVVPLEPDLDDASPSEALEVQHFLRGSVRQNLPLEAMRRSLSAGLAYSSTVGQEMWSKREPVFGTLESISAPVELSLRWFVGDILYQAELVDTGKIAAVPAEPIPIPQSVKHHDGRPIVCQLIQAGRAPDNFRIPYYALEPEPKLAIVGPEATFPAYRIGIRLGHTTADLLTRYLQHGMFDEASEAMLSHSMEAENLLLTKMQAPIAAAVGAYTLLRMGKLGQLHDWTSNLMNWFQWLADGAAIYGEHQARTGNHPAALSAFLTLRERGLPLFTEGLSYALERIRLYVSNESVAKQFPPADVEAGRELLNRLHKFSTHADFSRILLTYSAADPASPDSGQPDRPTREGDERPSPAPNAQSDGDENENQPGTAAESPHTGVSPPGDSSDSIPAAAQVASGATETPSPLSEPSLASPIATRPLMSTETGNRQQMEFVFNGINGATGDYLEPPMTAQTLSALALSDRAFPNSLSPFAFANNPAVAHFRDLTVKHQMGSMQPFGARFGVAMDKLEQAGWGVLTARGSDPKIAEALRPLLQLRKSQAGQFYKEYIDANGYAPNETKDQFLARNGMGPGPAAPDKVPYYILIVGDPNTIPYEFQYQLDVQYAVGRLWFDSIDDYARYAASVVMAESGKIALPRRAVLFGPQNPNDRATELSAQQLVSPLASRATTRGSAGQWQVETVVGTAATRSRLTSYLGGSETPALLFTASHGMGFPMDDPRQPLYQGALLCQDWPGPHAHGVDRSHYFAAEDIADSANLAGMIGFHFACYGAGTPRLDDFAHQQSRRPTAIAPRAFIAPLPQRMLSHPSGSALAFVGHVERAWGCSIVWPDAGPQIQAFEDALDVLMSGLPIGYALEGMSQRYADISSDLGADLLQIRGGTKPADDFAIAMQWTTNNDARSYVIIGDPAVRLPLAIPGSPGMPRPTLGSIVIPEATPASNSSSGQAGSQTAMPGTSNGNTSSTMSAGTMSAGTPASTDDSAANITAERQLAPQSNVASKHASASTTVTLPLHITVSVSVGDQSGEDSDSRKTAISSPSTGELASTATIDAEAFAIQIDPDYSAREGYDSDFLGTGSRRVPLPRLSAAQMADAAVVDAENGSDRHELKYHHYSVVLNARRRLAYFTAVNIDGRSASRPRRETDKWFYDPRVPRDSQVGNELYASNPFDRGHLVRRLDPAWGRSAKVIKRANDDTFHFTNCAPQHENFNQGSNLWAGLEDYLLDKAAGEDRRMTVFTGPVFTASDPLYRNVAVPKKYWKVAVISQPGGQLASLGFVVDQEKLLRTVVSFNPEDVAKTFQVPISQIEKLTGLNFGRLAQVDVGSVTSFVIGEPTERALNAFSDIILPSSSTVAGGPAMFAPSAGLATSPPEVISGTDLRYYLVAFDENGRERNDHPAGLISRLLDQAVADPTVTDVMLFSHGWQGDVPSARTQYSNWIRTMAANSADRAKIRQIRPGFKPVLVGIHWPSLAWGDENLAVSFGMPEARQDDAGGVALTLGEPSLAAALESYVGRLGDDPEARARIWTPLRTVLEATSRIATEPEALSAELREAYHQLDAAVGLATQGVAGDPSSDREPFDPERIYQSAKAESLQTAGTVAFGGGIFSREKLLAPLRVLTYWKMKDRARKIGEGAVHELLVRLQQAAAERDVRFHLIGHSFGCIIASGALSGQSPLPKPVASLTLLQGALSLWSYCADIPYAQGTPGYYHSLVAQGRVQGPIVTTRSRHDTAVGTWYPLASRANQTIAFAAEQLPKYGGIGSFGIQGHGLNIADIKILGIDGSYALASGGITNVEASDVIRNGSGISGAHSDICKPEIAHLVWSALTHT